MPQSFNKLTPKDTLSYALGAALYIPAVHPKLKDYLMTKKYKALTTLIICLEDGIADDKVEQAEQMVKMTFKALEKGIQEEKLREEQLPLLFIRTRSTKQLKKLLDESIILKYISGFSLPKFNTVEGEEQLRLIKKASIESKMPLYSMPILETEQIIDLQTGLEELRAIKEIIEHYKESVLNIRIGATDFSSIYGMRRTLDTTIYENSVLGECIGRIVNIFGKASEDYVISGPVWEFFSHPNQLPKSELRQIPFKQFENEGTHSSRKVLNRAEEGLIREILLDKANGLCGKTVIHPSQITYVNALQCITKEEYQDAIQILQTKDCGVIKSQQFNKMNEIKPHTNWAKKVLKRANIYGVMNENENYADLF